MFWNKNEQKSGSYQDGLTSLGNHLANSRNAVNTNKFTHRKVDDAELQAMYKLGIVSKIIRLKTGYALNDPWTFENEKEQGIYNTRLAKIVKTACQYQLGFGRGVVLIAKRGEDLNTPMRGTADLSNSVIHVFDNTKVTVSGYSQDLLNERYWKPQTYNINGQSIHWTRIVDFTYYQPSIDDMPDYDFAGLSESELIYEQLIADGTISRAMPSILEKMSTMFYGIKGFKDLLRSKQEQGIVEFFTRLENMRSIYGAGLHDSEDTPNVVNQSLAGLKDVNETSLRRVAMVTGLPMPFLVGEGVSGLNSSGQTERDTLNDTVSAYRKDYIFDPVNELLRKFGMNKVAIKESSNLNPTEQVNYEKAVILNAKELMQMGQDHQTYLEEKGIVKPLPLFSFDFSEGDNSGN